MNYTLCIFCNYNLVTHAIALLRSYFAQHYCKVATKDMVAFVLEKLQSAGMKSVAQILVSHGIAQQPSEQYYRSLTHRAER